MIETVAVSAVVPPGRRGREGLWPRISTGASGAAAWRADQRQLPEGVGSVVLTKTPTGERAVRVEANLTSLTHGAARKYAGLRTAELPDALRTVCEVGAWAVPGCSSDPAAWRVKRLDPSVTFLLPGRVNEVVDSARQSWRRAAGARQLVADYGSSVRWQLRKHESWTVYDKSAEHGAGCPEGLVRLEIRRHLVREVVMVDEINNGMTEEQLDAAIDSLSSLAAGTLMQITEQLVRGGASPGEALKLSGVTLLLADYGEHALVNVGLPASTARRLRARVRELLDAAGELPEPESGSAILRGAQRVYAADVG